MPNPTQPRSIDYTLALLPHFDQLMLACEKAVDAKVGRPEPAPYPRQYHEYMQQIGG